jgi:hypothetical protein
VETGGKEMAIAVKQSKNMYILTYCIPDLNAFCRRNNMQIIYSVSTD